MSRIYISAAHKSSGKTTLSIGLCRALHQRNLTVQPFKKGPDYIDPLWLAKASGFPTGLSGEENNSQYPSEYRGCHNLDFNTMDDDEIKRVLSQHSQQADISIIEGNKGLYDGVALDGSDSNAALAKLTQSPVILVIDTRGVTRGVAPLLLGYQQFDKDINIAGVIYNMSSGGRHEEKIRAVTKAYTDIPVLGVVKKSPLLELDERHLGLMPSNEHEGAEKKIDEIASVVADQVDLDAVFAVAKTAETLAVKPITSVILETAKKVRIGICEDSACGFYYVGDKQALKDAGAELVLINTLEDEGLPELDGLFIGGGFPETHMQALADNTTMRYQIKRAIEAGLPTYAECGGLMYLSQSLHWNGQSAPMVGIIPSDTVMHKKPQGRGHVELIETESMPWSSGTLFNNSYNNSMHDLSNNDINDKERVIKAHEFHYSRLETPDRLRNKGKFAYKVKRGVGITGEEDGWVYKNLLASYAHMRDTENYHWAKRFVDFVREKKK